MNDVERQKALVAAHEELGMAIEALRYIDPSAEGWRECADDALFDATYAVQEMARLTSKIEDDE